MLRGKQRQVARSPRFPLDNSSKLMDFPPMAYNLGKHFEDIIRRLRATGRYQNDSEVIRAGLRLLEDHEFAPAALELELVKSLDSPVRPIEKNWARRMKRAARRLRKQRPAPGESRAA